MATERRFALQGKANRKLTQPEGRGWLSAAGPNKMRLMATSTRAGVGAGRPAPNKYDYIVVGAGSAGCVVAERLTADRTTSLLLLEAGGPDRSLMLRIPAALSWPLQNDRFIWNYRTEPEPGMDERRMNCPRGKVIGGSSTINGMMHARGHALDFDGWAKNDLPEWSYAHCLPYFKKAETFDRGGDDYRGGNGPLHVTAPRISNPLYGVFLEAVRQAGYPETADLNGYRQEGFGIVDQTIHRGRRWSAADAYLRPALRRANLSLAMNALALRLLFDGTRAVGVEYACKGEVRQAFTERGVILCGGSINSPQLLMVSGLGDADHLREHAIPVIGHLPGVGGNLQDHLDFCVQVKCKRPVSYYPATTPLGRLGVGLRWLLTRDGVCATNLMEAGGYIRSRADAAHPNLQCTFMALAADYSGANSYRGHGYQAFFDLMRPASRGRVRLNSADPREPPSILFNYLTAETDRRDVVDGLRLTRGILGQAAFAPYDGGEFNPGPEVRTDDEIVAWARTTGETEYHPVGTCAMGTGDTAVVDGALRVHGIEGLRVVDASIMPTVVSANTNAATIMLAEKAADIIAGKPPLEPLYAPVYPA